MYDYKMFVKLLNKFLTNSLIILVISSSVVFSKTMTLEKVEDLRLNMIEKKNKRSLVKLIEIYKDY